MSILQPSQPSKFLRLLPNRLEVVIGLYLQMDGMVLISSLCLQLRKILLFGLDQLSILRSLQHNKYLIIVMMEGSIMLGFGFLSFLLSFKFGQALRSLLGCAILDNKFKSEAGGRYVRFIFGTQCIFNVLLLSVKVCTCEEKKSSTSCRSTGVCGACF